jgi:3-methyladenine DNA glycosylase Tag
VISLRKLCEYGKSSKGWNNMEAKNEIYTDNEGVVLGENAKQAPMDDNKIMKNDTDVVAEKTNADVVQEMKNPVLTLSSIAVTPNAPDKLAIGATQQFKAMGSYSDKSTADITSKVSWNSSNKAVDTISSSGLATGVGIGSANITASMSGITSPFVSFQR